MDSWLYDYFHAIVSFVIGVIVYWLGGYDLMLSTLLFLTVFDFISGTGQAIYNGNFSAKQSVRGTMKKVFIYMTVALSVAVQRFLGDVVPIRETVVIFYIISEGLSSVENIGKVIEYPEELRNIFAQYLKGDDEHE